MPEDNREEELGELDALGGQDELATDELATDAVGGLGEESGELGQDTGQDTEQKTDDAQPVPVAPQPVSAPVPLVPALEPARPAPPKNELADLFEVPQDTDNDMYIDDLFEIDEDDFEYEGEDDLSDLTRVTREDVMGTPPKPRPQRFRRTERPYTPPPAMGGLR